MAARSDTNNPLSKLIREPLERISKQITEMIKTTQQISDMVEGPFKIEQLEKLAITNPAYETLAAQIKRANDFYELLQLVAKEKLEIAQLFQLMNEQAKEKQALYKQLEMEYETLFKNILVSSDKMVNLDKDYLEREYLEKLKALSNQLDSIIESLKNNIQILQIRIKEIDTEIKDLDIKISENKQNLTELINELFEVDNTKPDIEKVIIAIPVYTEDGEAVIQAEEGQETVELEFNFDQNQDKHVLTTLLHDAVKEGKLEKEDLITQFKNHLVQHTDNQIKPRLVRLDWTLQERLDFILKIPDIEKFIANRAETTFEKLEQTPLFETILEKFKIHNANLEKREELLKNKHAYEKQVEIQESNINEIGVLRDNTTKLNEFFKNPSTMSLNEIQKSIQLATETIAKIGKEQPLLSPNKPANDPQIKPEEPQTPKTPRRRAT